MPVRLAIADFSPMKVPELEQLIAQAPMAMCVVSVPELVVEVVNQRFVQLGVDEPPGRGRPLSESGPRTLAGRLVPICQEVLTSSEAFVKDEVRAGSRRFEVTAVPLRGSDDLVWGIVLTLLEFPADAPTTGEARELRIASRFQSAVLPRGRVQVPGFAVAHTYRPGLAEADVGGDFYNVFELGPRGTCLVVGDVGGKGLEAAIVAARVQHSLVALALNDDSSPGTVLTGVHRVCAAMEPTEQIVTVFTGFLEGGTGRLVYANAGHEPPMIWRSRSQAVEQLESGEMAIVSLEADFPHTTRQTTLEPGDVLLLFTDGLTEAHPLGGRELFGSARVSDLLARFWDRDPATLIERMYHAALAFSRGFLRDDIAMVAMRRLSSEDSQIESTFVAPPGGPSGRPERSPE